MSWMERLYRTYENSTMEIGAATAAPEHGKSAATPLLPICHTTQNAQIEITVDWQGSWQPHTARVLEKTDGVTIIPCTENSSGRTSGLCPHPLFDKLQYLAGDYITFGGAPKRDGYALYMEALGAWCASPHAHPAVQAIYTYLQKGCLIADLVREGILLCGEDGALLPKWTGDGEKQGVFRQMDDQFAAFVRFTVSGAEGLCILYEDSGVRDSFIRYQASLETETDLCYVQGTWLTRSESAPGKIRNTGDKAKLISSNDGNTNEFTFKGRFATAAQTVSVSFETMHKAHNALKWLISRQGWRNGDQVVLVWGTQNEPCPSFMQDGYDLVLESAGLDNDLFADLAAPLPREADTFAAYAQKVNRALSGWGRRLTHDAAISVLVLDSTNGMIGRLSIPYYRELGGGEFLKRLNLWYSTCAWPMERKKETQSGKREWVCFVGAPSPNDIVTAAYGSSAGDKLQKSAIERLLPCVIDGAPLPRDLVACAVRRASAPLAVEEWEWRQMLPVACALVRKQRNDAVSRMDRKKWDITSYKEVYSMALDTQNHERAYLFGRLLAYAEQAEGLALFKNGDARQTNAVRLMHQFSVKPASTWRYLDEQLTYYYGKLNDCGNWFKSQIDAVMAQFSPADYTDTRLEDIYLLGYHSQLAALRTRKEAKIDENTD